MPEGVNEHISKRTGFVWGVFGTGEREIRVMVDIFDPGFPANLTSLAFAPDSPDRDNFLKQIKRQVMGRRPESGSTYLPLDHIEIPLPGSQQMPGSSIINCDRALDPQHPDRKDKFIFYASVSSGNAKK